MDIRVKAAQVSVISNSVLTAMKLIVGLLMGSVSIISEAIHSGLDLAAALIAFFSLRQAAQPADDRHQFGHGKIENISGVVEALLIFMAAIWIIFEAYKKLAHRTGVESLGFGIAVMGAAALANALVSRYLFSVAKKTDSIALKADALHLSTDVVTSLGVMVGLGLIKVTGLNILDPIVAIAVALLIIKASVDLIKEAFLPLMDTKLPEAEEKIIIDTINKYKTHFVEFHKLRSRKAGSERHIDLHLVVPPDKAVKDVHQICDQIEDEIENRLASSHVLIHVEPCKNECLSCISRSSCEDFDNSP